jgi:hypothetical protein
MKRSIVLALGAALLALPVTVEAQQGPNHPPADAHVDFGVLQLSPLGPPPCSQVAPFGGPTDPCAYKIHHLTPEEVTISKGGEVTIQIHGGGHAPAIYEVSKNTTRFDLGQFLCPGDDPKDAPTPADHPCPTNNANLARSILDGKGDVVIVAGPGGTVHPDNRVWSPEGRLMSLGGVQFANGGTTDPTGTSPTGGELATYRFLKTGRYLVICMNRAHFLNDWMFGFVNVVGEKGEQ